jgi:hypothetical protein
MTLLQCFDRYACDRGSRRHRYDRVYEGLQPRRILEIGVFRGAGVAAWLDYTSAEIVCVDLFQRMAPEKIDVLNHPRVAWHRGDSKTIHLTGTFDLIIDDGAHDPDSQRRTFENLHNLCTGQYFIEDVWPLDELDSRQRKDPWIQKPEYAMDKYLRLLNTVSAHDLTRHDLRHGFAPDSYLFEIRC